MAICDSVCPSARWRSPPLVAQGQGEFGILLRITRHMKRPVRQSQFSSVAR